MEFRLTTDHFENIENQKIKEKLKELYNIFLKETKKGNKVAFYYEDLNNNILSFNENICFYSASTIKILVCLLIYKLADEGKINLNDKLLVTQEELFEGSGVIKNQKENTEYSIEKLIELCLVESDNTAYIKLVKYVGKENIINFGKKLGALHTLEGKDSYGIVNCLDMIIYWKELKKYIENSENGTKIKKYLLNSSVKYIKNDKYVRKYGEFDIAYHEAGYVDSNKPYYMIVLTQLNKFDYKEEYINKIAKLIEEINREN